MTTIKDLKEWLDRFPDETEVSFAFQQPPSCFQAYGSVDFVSPELRNEDIGVGWEFTDFRNNEFVKQDDDHYNKCYLELGEIE